MSQQSKPIWPLIAAGVLLAYAFGAIQLPDSLDIDITPMPCISNEYGVGKIAYKNAPRDDADEIDTVASIYEKAGDFLFGQPSFKFIDSSNRRDADNPDRSVPAWINQEMESVNGWDSWRSKISDALTESQRSKQFGPKDWDAAFDEIAAALEAI